MQNNILLKTLINIEPGKYIIYEYKKLWWCFWNTNNLDFYSLKPKYIILITNNNSNITFSLYEYVFLTKTFISVLSDKECLSKHLIIDTKGNFIRFNHGKYFTIFKYSKPPLDEEINEYIEYLNKCFVTNYFRCKKL